MTELPIANREVVISTEKEYKQAIREGSLS